MLEEVGLKIDGREVKAKKGMAILEVAQEVGIKIPTLCYHKALSPVGACRLCTVEVTGKGRSRLVTSCNYPVEEGIVVNTDSPEVINTRKLLLELLLARCPDVKIIQDLAREYGVEKPRVKKVKNENCILCGLCTRICQERMGVSAINFVGRGIHRKVSTPFDTYSDICQTCGACAYICPTRAIKLEDITKNRPIPILSEFNAGLSSRSPIYIPYPQAVPNAPVIDRETCIHFLKGECGICKEVCKAEAIDYEQKEETVELNVGAIVLSPGYESFDAKAKQELGYGRYANVVSALEFERILSASGPFQGHLQRPSDQKAPKRIAFMQCIGSRDHERDYCSSVCCMYATKEAIIAKEHVGEGLDCDIFFMDMRAFSKGFEAYFERAKELGVNYIRC
ncbi:MAG: 2Fe-2S iron-sulfur cluster-binding protein, partial [Thermodesulfobacteriota bacterium]